MSFWTWLGKKINEDSKNGTTGGTTNKYNTIVDVAGLSDNNVSSEKKIEFEIHFAEGGVVLQQRQYNKIKDRNYNKLFLIPDDKDVAKEIGDFVAMEILRS